MPDPFEPIALPSIRFEDEALAVVEKPARMHSAPGKGRGPVLEAMPGSQPYSSLCEWFLASRPGAALDVAELPAGRSREEGGLVHRLDFETSGLVLFAKTPAALQALMVSQAAGHFIKSYLLRCAPSRRASPEGSRPPRTAPSGIDPEVWDKAIATEPPDLGKLALWIAAGGLSVECRFRPWGPGRARVACVAPALKIPKESTRGTYTTRLVAATEAADGLLVEVELPRGFRHQVRAHLAWIGLPLDGDSLYGGKPAQRLFLHSWGFRFPHPSDGGLVDFRGVLR